MPPTISNNVAKKKKKGRAPAHQNVFAYKHNPKSKLTQKILESPNIHVCRRCHEKIEWRKQYRKYKPRTQPGKCNECEKRNVLSAYHTICVSCTTNSVKAKNIILAEHKEEEEDTDETVRVCAVCVKEIALPDPEEDDHEEFIQSLGKIKLREKRTIERQLANKTVTKSSLLASDDNDNDDASQEEASEDDTVNHDSAEDTTEHNKIEADEDDPFLMAIGGADKLVTGLEYQKKLLEQQQVS